MGSSSLCGAAIQLRRLPQNTTRETLRSMLLFSDKLIDARLVENSYPEDEGFCTAIAHFSTTDAADHARGMLDGKDNTTRNAKMIVSTLHTQSSDDSLPISRRNTVGHASAGVMDDPTMPPLARQVSRFNDAFRSKGFSTTENATSANGNLPTPSTEINSPFYLAQPPVGTLQDRPRVTGKSVIDQDPDDETGDLIRDAVGYFRNGLPGSIDSPRRSTESSITSRVSGLSLSTNLNPSAMAPQANPRSAMSFTSPSSSKTPSSVSGGIHSAGATTGFQPQSRKFRYHAPPANHADQNPPCNTLYVGNLQPDTSEDELKSVFSKQRGYKRLCFRPKPGNSPMCFVEFHDISSATKALYELYGVELSNSGSRGGIRLSFSKNPLGVRGPSNNVNGNPPAPRNGHTGAGPPLFTTASGPPPGLAAPPNISLHGGNGISSPHSAIGGTPTNGTFPMSNGIGPSHGPLGNASANGAYGLSNGIGSSHNTTPTNGALSMGSGIGSLNSLDTTTANPGLSLLNGVGHNHLGNAPTSGPLPGGNGMGVTSGSLVSSPTNGAFNLNSGLGGFQPLRSPPINGSTGFFPASPNPGSPNANSFADYLGGR